MNNNAFDLLDLRRKDLMLCSKNNTPRKLVCRRQVNWVLAVLERYNKLELNFWYINSLLPWALCSEYINLRSKNMDSRKLLIAYPNIRCYSHLRLPYKSDTTKRIVEYLNLKSPEKYTWHGLRSLQHQSKVKIVSNDMLIRFLQLALKVIV